MEATVCVWRQRCEYGSNGISKEATVYVGNGVSMEATA